eukprot:gene28475-37425_t
MYFFFDISPIEPAQPLTIVAGVWITLYVIVCKIFFSSPLIVDIEEEKPIKRAVSSRSDSAPLKDILVTDSCLSMSKQIQVSAAGHALAEYRVGVVIVTRNEKPVSNLYETVRSLLSNSPTEVLSDVVVVDDFSDRPVSMPASILKAFPQVSIRVVRLPAHKGIAFAKNRGAEELARTAGIPLSGHDAKGDAVPKDPKHPKVAVFFADSHTLFGSGWLYPLLNSMLKYEGKALAYPVIDILVAPPQEELTATLSDMQVVQADDAVAAFDWSLLPRWEPIQDPTLPAVRVKTGLSSVDLTQPEALSPSVPGMFLVDLEYFFLKLGGGFDEMLFSSYYGQENVELAVRVWLCGGIVVRQSCSRIAHKTPNMFKDQVVGNGVTQSMIDKNALNIANKWFSSTNNGFNELRETVYQARFLGRLPYAVESSTDPIQTAPYIASNPETVGQDEKSLFTTCMLFNWFLDEVYPGLLADRSIIEAAYTQHLSGDLSMQFLRPLIDQYSKVTAVAVNSHDSARIHERQRLMQESDGSFHTDLFGTTFAKSGVFVEPPPVVRPKEPSLADKQALFAQKVRTSLVCEDYPTEIDAFSCVSRLATNQNMCEEKKTELLFVCAKTCGYCDDQGLYCEDFYLKKCAEWKAQNLCGQEDVSSKCRRSCGLCTQIGDAKLEEEQLAKIREDIAQSVDSETKEEENVGEQAEGDAPPVERPQPVAVIEAIQPPPHPIEAIETEVDALLAHREFLEGKLPNVFAEKSNGQDACELKNRDHGRLMSRIKLRISDVPVGGQGIRLFCGIYTMEKNHDTNVKATKLTWAKKCDGFIAFSTKKDPTIPSVNITHEGEESYDNMWQKSRSIWKYIAKHYLDSFDYFLLGGDDMFYIIENLRAYLNSQEIQNLRNERNGLYIGRIFQPPNQIVFNSGGAGYTLDTKALKLLQDNIDTPKCFPHQHGFWEDVNTANCLKTQQIVPYDTRDSQERERFHPFTPGQHLAYRIPPNPDWYPKYNPHLKIGYDCCSDESISFHYVPATLLYQLHDYMYNCPLR